MYNNLLDVTLGTGSKNRLFYHLHSQFIDVLVRIAVLNCRLPSKNDDIAGQLDMVGGVKMGIGKAWVGKFKYGRELW